MTSITQLHGKPLYYIMSLNFQIMHPHKTLQIYQLSTPKNRSKNTLKPEIQEWIHPLYKCKVKNTLCRIELNCATMSLIAPTTFFWFHCGGADAVSLN